jgi:hypothetical protein
MEEKNISGEDSAPLEWGGKMAGKPGRQRTGLTRDLALERKGTLRSQEDISLEITTV